MKNQSKFWPQGKRLLCQEATKELHCPLRFRLTSITRMGDSITPAGACTLFLLRISLLLDATLQNPRTSGEETAALLLALRAGGHVTTARFWLRRLSGNFSKSSVMFGGNCPTPLQQRNATDESQHPSSEGTDSNPLLIPVQGHRAAGSKTATVGRRRSSPWTGRQSHSSLSNTEEWDESWMLG